MAVFLSKEEILGGVREVPAANAAAPFTGGGFTGGGSGIDQIERILSQINGILTQVNSIRNNPTTRALIGDRGGAPLPIAPASATLPNEPPQFASQPPAAPNYARADTTATPISAASVPAQKQPDIDEQGVKDFLKAVMEELDAAPESLKNTSLGMVCFAYKNLPDKRAELEKTAIGKMREWRGRLFK